MGTLRALLFYTGISVTALIFSLLGILLLPLPFHTRARVVTLWTHSTLWWLKICCGVRCRVQGREHIPPGPAIILCKHQSAWETMGLQQVFPAQVWVFKRELLWIPFFGWGLAVLDPIAVDRSAKRKALKQLIADGKERLGRGIWITLFPEGTRVAPGKKGEYHAGGGLLAKEANVPVVPVAHNAGLFWPKHSFAKRPGTIDLVVGPCIDPAGKSARQIMEIAENWIENTSQSLLSTGETPAPDAIATDRRLL
jgi:1-acyl-sn-glycerol-3-phosphate acyltransferase